MKILLTTPYSLDVEGGVNNQLWLLYRHLKQIDTLKVRMLAPSSDPARWDDPDVMTMGRVTTIQANGSTASLCLDPTIRPGVRRVLQDFQPDIIHLQEPLSPFLNHVVLSLSTAMNVGTFHTYGNSRWPYRLTRPLLSRLHRKLDLKIAVSEPARDYISASFSGHYDIIPNCIEVGPDLPSGQCSRPHTKKTVLFVGRLNDPRKGLQYLLDAYDDLERRSPGVYRLCIVGRGHEAWRAHPSSGDIQWMGAVSDIALKEAYAACDVLCAPSIGGESFGIILLEAFSQGKPVVAFDIAGYAELVSHGKNGLLVPNRDTVALANAIEKTLACPKQYDQMGQAARERARRYEASVVIRTILGRYQDLLATGKRRGEVALPKRLAI